MAIQAGIGSSVLPADSHQAGYEACVEALEKLGSSKPSLVLVFASVTCDQQEVIKGVRSVVPESTVVGCSTAGEIIGTQVLQQSVAVIAIASDSVQFTPGIAYPTEGLHDGMAIGKAFAQSIAEQHPQPLRACLLFPDVLSMNGADVMRGVSSELDEHLPIVGGAAGDDFAFKQTFEYFNDEVISGGAVGVGISGENLAMGLGVRHGWMPIGLPMIATRSEGAVLYEIDGRPAISIYEDYFQEKAEELRRQPLAQTAITYPLGLRVPGYDEYLIRDPLTIGEDGSITCAAEIPQGSEIRLMIGSRERAIEAAQEATQKLMRDMKAQNADLTVLLVFNCIARKKLYGTKAVDEMKAIVDIAGKDVSVVGFYTYGEMAPLGGELLQHEKIKPQFYNETIVLFGLGERGV